MLPTRLDSTSDLPSLKHFSNNTPPGQPRDNPLTDILPAAYILMGETSNIGVVDELGLPQASRGACGLLREPQEGLPLQDEPIRAGGL